MSKIIRMIINGVRGVGMSEGMRSIFQTRPPRRIPVILSAEEAAAADFDALSSDWAKVCGDLELDPRSWSSVDDFMRDLVADCESDQAFVHDGVDGASDIVRRSPAFA